MDVTCINWACQNDLEHPGAHLPEASSDGPVLQDKCNCIFYKSQEDKVTDEDDVTGKRQLLFQKNQREPRYKDTSTHRSRRITEHKFESQIYRAKPIKESTQKSSSLLVDQNWKLTDKTESVECHYHHLFFKTAMKEARTFVNMAYNQTLTNEDMEEDYKTQWKHLVTSREGEATLYDTSEKAYFAESSEESQWGYDLPSCLYSNEIIALKFYDNIGRTTDSSIHDSELNLMRNCDNQVYAPGFVHNDQDFDEDHEKDIVDNYVLELKRDETFCASYKGYQDWDRFNQFRYRKDNKETASFRDKNNNDISTGSPEFPPLPESGIMKTSSLPERNKKRPPALSKVMIREDSRDSFEKRNLPLKLPNIEEIIPGRPLPIDLTTRQTKRFMSLPVVDVTPEAKCRSYFKSCIKPDDSEICNNLKLATLHSPSKKVRIDFNFNEFKTKMRELFSTSNYKSQAQCKTLGGANRPEPKTSRNKSLERREDGLCNKNTEYPKVFKATLKQAETMDRPTINLLELGKPKAMEIGPFLRSEADNESRNAKIPNDTCAFECSMTDMLNKSSHEKTSLQDTLQNLPKSPATRNDASKIPFVKSTPVGNASTCSSKTRRKQARPQKSPEMWDPSFRGATILFSGASCSDVFLSPCPSPISKYGSHSSIKSNSEPSVTSKSTLEKEVILEYIVTEPHSHSSLLCPVASKSCASCDTKKTPMWRDAEDGTPLCNACGIRFRKYRLRCSRCWHIPKKDSKTFPDCDQCGSRLRLQGRLHKHSASFNSQ